MKTKEILIIGLGGVGGYFGFKLAQKYRSEAAAKIAFVARETTFEVVKEKGLTLLSSEHTDNIARPNKIFREVSEAGSADLIIVCVKEYDLENVCVALKEKIAADTVLLPLMNGVDIYERIRRVLSRGIILPACVYVASHIKEKGVIEHHGKPGKIIFGKDPNNTHFDSRQIAKLLIDAGIDAEYKENSLTDIWTKFIFIASFGLVSARYDKSIGEVNETPFLCQRASLIMREIENAARAKGVELPENIIELTFEKAATFPFETPTSLQLDVNSGRENNELELFAGAIINLGEDLDMSVVETEKIYNEITI